MSDLDSTSSTAFLKPADVGSAISKAGADSVLSTTSIWLITIVVGMVIVGLVVALIKKK